MSNIGLSDYILGEWMNRDEPSIGTKVCASNGCTNVGIVVGVGSRPKENYRAGDRKIDVLWGTGKKRGLRETRLAKNLTNFDQYLQKHREEYERLQILSNEASTVGL